MYCSISQKQSPFYFAVFSKTKIRGAIFFVLTLKTFTKKFFSSEDAYSFLAALPGLPAQSSKEKFMGDFREKHLNI